MCSHRGQKPVQEGDAVSIIAGDKNCRLREHLDQTPQGVSNIPLDAQRRAVFDFSEMVAAAGYKLCVCPTSGVVAEGDGPHCPDDVAFEEDIRISVQKLLQGLDLKGLISGTSVRKTFLARKPASRLRFCSRASFHGFFWRREIQNNGHWQLSVCC